MSDVGRHVEKVDQCPLENDLVIWGHMKSMQTYVLVEVRRNVGRGFSVKWTLAFEKVLRTFARLQNDQVEPVSSCDERSFYQEIKHIFFELTRLRLTGNIGGYNGWIELIDNQFIDFAAAPIP